MRDTTKVLKEEMENDISKIIYKNNSKIYKRTPEQNKQAIDSKIKYFTDKWNQLKKTAETEAQKNYCERVLNIIPTIKTVHYGYPTNEYEKDKGPAALTSSYYRNKNKRFINIIRDKIKTERENKNMDIKNLEITEQIYIRALEVEKAYNRFEDATGTEKENKAFKIWDNLDKAFKNEYTSKFEAFEIIKEYQERTF